MASTAPTNLGRRLRLAVAGAAALAALTVPTAGASAATPAETPGPALARLGAGGLAGGPGSGLRARSGPATGPRTRIPGYLLQRGRYLRFDAPDAVQQTNPFGINNRGVIVGKHTTADGVDHGFRRDARGRFVTIDVPGGVPTQLNKINDRGQIVGRYQTIPGVYSFRGFLLTDGRLVRLDVPGARYTQPLGINNRGQVVGEYQDAAGRFHGYVWERGRFTTIDLPGQPGTTTATGINNRGQITGQAGPLEARIGFVLDRGRFTTFRVPGAQVTFAYGINDQGQVVGFSAASLTATTASGFLRDARGRLTAINRPGKTITIAFDINNRGQIVGVAGTPDPPPSPPAAEAAPMGGMA